MYEARRIANLVLEIGDPVSNSITNFKLNKILYFLHGWSLARLEQPLIRNRLEAWKHGPVIRSVYRAFKEYGNEPVTGKATYLDYASNSIKEIDTTGLDPYHVSFIEGILPHYVTLTASQLYDLTHTSGGPWDLSFRLALEGSHQWSPIPNGLIKEYFEKSVGKSRSH